MVKDNSAGSYDKVEVPESFIIARKQEKLSEEMLKTTIPVKTHFYGGRYRVTLKNLQSLKGQIYYGFSEDNSTLENGTYTFRSLSSSDYLASGYDLGRGKAKGTLFISISKGNEKYMKMLGKKAIHIDYFYQTFVVRKIDKIVASKINKKVEDKFDENVLSIFKGSDFKFVDENVYNTATKIANLIRETERNYGGYVNEHLISIKLGINLSEIDAKFPMQKELDYLIELSNKNRNRLKWINMPYNGIEMDQEDHRELVEMLELMFDR
jgi:hypothetical protein